MKDKTEKLIDEKIEQISNILKCKDTDRYIGQIIALALDKVSPEKGMGNYHLEQIDIHNRAIAFEKRMEFFDRLFDFLRENNHTKDNPNISEHDSAWTYKYNTKRGKIRKVIAISNMMGSRSHLFIKEEQYIGDEDWSRYYIVRAFDNPDKFYKECGRKSLKTLAQNGKLNFFIENYADGDRRLSFDSYESGLHDYNLFSYDYERCVLRYDCNDRHRSIHNYFNTGKSCEYALGQLESAYWMRTE